MIRPILRSAAIPVRRAAKKALLELVPELRFIELPGMVWKRLAANRVSCTIDPDALLYAPYSLVDCVVGRYTYIAENAYMCGTTIGAFCSVGPNLLCGWGSHPTNGLSTSPMFYSTKAQNGTTLSPVDKFAENDSIRVGNDVFIGMNVTIVDGVTIGDGAIVGAGAVVIDDVPPYAIVAGVPAKVVRYRFDPATIRRLLEIKWWEFDLAGLADVERSFWDVEGFVRKH